MLDLYQGIRGQVILMREMQNDQVLHDMIETIYQERRPKYQDRNRSPGQIQKLRTTIITTDELFLCDIDYY